MRDGSRRRAFAVLGRPVDHSVSPAIHRAAFAALGLEASYRAVETEASELETLLRRYARRGGGNVTLPHKERAAGLLERRTPEVESTGACNCFWGDVAGQLAGDNTDVGGFLAAVGEMGVPLRGSRVLLLGAGGAARAVLVGCLREWVGRVEVLNRTPSRARRMASQTAGDDPRVAVLEGGSAAGPYDLVVNATRLGLHPSDPLPCDPAACGAGAALDLVYAPGETEWARRARGAGVPARDGLGMLVHQAALSLRRWFPDVEPPLAAMREAAEAALRRSARGAPSHRGGR